MPAPLEGIKVVDFTRYQNGPHATAMLADMGAEVLKVEMPGNGDPGRQLGVGADGFCSYFESLNRGKRSMTLDLRAEGALEVVHKLVEEADVLAENFRPGYLDSIGLGYEDLREVNPRLIYATNSGFGPNGEWATRGSFDVVAQGMSGAMVALGGGPGERPFTAPWGLADQTGSIVFAYGIMTALFARARHGVGQKIDVSQLGAMLTLQVLSLQAYLHNNVQPVQKPGRSLSATFSWYQAGDGEWFTMGLLDPKSWPSLCEALERPDLLEDARTVDPFKRRDNEEWLRGELEALFRTRPREEWLERLIAARIPCGPIYDYAQIAADQHFWINGYLQEVPHAHFENHRVVGVPVSFSETPTKVQSAAPELGQNTEEVLLSLGYDWSDIERFHDAGVTAVRRADSAAAGG